MGIFGTSTIRMIFTVDSVTYDKTLTAQNYFYEHKYNTKLLKVRRNIRSGAKKQVFKGNEKEFAFTIFEITAEEWEGFYQYLKDATQIEIYPHSDLEYSYNCYCDKIEFELWETKDTGVINIVLKTNQYKDVRITEWILEQGAWNDDGVWMDLKTWQDS